MASLMEELLDVLGKEEKQYQELITLASEKTDAVDKIYYDRADRLAASGIKISKAEFERLAE